MLDIETEWTLNALLTTSSSYRKCSKRRTLDHSAQATSPLQIEGTTRCSRTALGSGCGSILASVAEPNPRYSGWAKSRANLRKGSTNPPSGLDLSSSVPVRASESLPLYMPLPVAFWSGLLSCQPPLTIESSLPSRCRSKLSCSRCLLCGCTSICHCDPPRSRRHHKPESKVA